MCSVVGYVGSGYSRKVVLEGLSRLEYRGYDSAGFACLNPKDNRLLYAKAPGRLSNVVELLSKEPIDGRLGIGHTRWATHGGLSVDNAHPHFDCNKTISLVHNGIIENYHVLKNQLLEAGHTFHSQTDSEIIAHLFESFLITHKTFKGAIIDLANHLEGAYAFISLLQDYPDQMVVVRKRSPLCIGIGDDEIFVASDILAFAGKTNKVVFLPDKSFGIIRKDFIELFDFTGKPIPIHVQEVDVDWDTHEKKGHRHFMLKEIYEQKCAIHETIGFLRAINHRVWDHIGTSKQVIKDLQHIGLVGCGTSWYAARIAQFFFEALCSLPTAAHLASEFRYMLYFPRDNTLNIMISQSGETADTLEALRKIQSADQPTAALTNVASSTMVREADGFLLTQAGPEVAVASTKAFSTQLTVLYWLAHRIAQEKGFIDQYQLEAAEEELLVAAEVLENAIENYKRDILNIHAPFYSTFEKAIFLGRHVSYPFAMEAALKLKEIAYIFSQCYPAGELKHGPIALIDKNIPIFLFSHQDEIIYQKLVVNAQEVKARKGHLVAFIFEGQTELEELADLVFIFPRINPLLGPLAMTGLMQFFVYAIADELNRPIDKPRNLAKSVTVE